MPHDDRMTFTPNLVVGLGIMLLGILLILDRLGLVEAREVLRFWPVLLVIFGASVVMQALRANADHPPRDSEGSIVSVPLVALLVIVFLLASHAERRRDIAAGHATGETASLLAVMGRDHRASVAKRFRGGEMTTIMGRTHLDLRQAAIAPGEEAVIDVLGLMGRVVLQVPRDWIVDVQAVSVMGGVRDDRPRAARSETAPIASDVLERTDGPIEGSPPPRVVLRGFILMGALVIGA